MPVVVCYGDSNTHGYDVATGGRFPREVRWPGVLAAELRGVADVIEEGLNGRTTVWDDPMLDGRNGRDYLLPCLRSHAPVDVVVIMLGTNDTKGFLHLGAPDIAHGVGALADLVLLSGTGPSGGPPRVLLVAPPLLGELTAESEVWGFGEARAKSEQFGRLYRVVAEQRGLAFVDAGPVAEIDPGDGVHLTAAGQDALGRAIAEVVRGILA
jgi:lysophospholipase L1-like esterase